MRKRFVFETRVIKEQDYYLKIKTLRDEGMIPYPITFSELNLPLEIRASGKGYTSKFDFNNAYYTTGESFSNSYQTKEDQKNVLNKLEKSLKNRLPKMVMDYENGKTKWVKIRVFEEAIKPLDISVGGKRIKSSTIKHSRGSGFKF